MRFQLYGTYVTRLIGVATEHGDTRIRVAAMLPLPATATLTVSEGMMSQICDLRGIFHPSGLKLLRQ